MARTMSLDPDKITVKCVEISKCLINKEAGFHDYDLDVSRTIGDLARLVVNIRQTESIDPKKLSAISTAIKQDFRILRSDLLPTLEDLGWIEIHMDGKRIKRIDEYVPPLEDVVSDLGNLWHEKRPTPIDYATVKSLNLLTKKPYTQDELISDLDISENDFNSALNYGIQTNYLGKFYSENIEKDIIWTPYYWGGKVDSVKNFLRKQSNEQFERIGNLVNNLLDYPGKPLEFLKQEEGLVEAGIGCGLFPSVGVKDRRGISHEYLFAATPQFELDPKRDIFEKARLLVACIRHGEHHAEVTKIKYPLSILKALRENRLKPHSYARIQYALLIINGICTYEDVDRSYGKAYKIIYNDTPENNLAMDIAEELLKGSESISGIAQEPEVKELLTKGVFNYSAEQRQIKNRVKIVAKEEFERLLESMQGSGVFS